MSSHVGILTAGTKAGSGFASRRRVATGKRRGGADGRKVLQGTLVEHGLIGDTSKDESLAADGFETHTPEINLNLCRSARASFVLYLRVIHADSLDHVQAERRARVSWR
jgi:hypothetical protein